jgi:L-asparaginase II
MYRRAAEQLIKAGTAPTALHNNCSGKHAAMLLLAQHLGADPARYLEPDSPVQTQLRAAVARHLEVPEAALDMAVDGCSAPTFGAPLAALARGYAHLAAALPGTPGDPHLGRLARAMTGHPDMVAGSGRLDTAIMAAAPGRVVAKVGAEGLYAVAALTPAGPLGLAVKVADGDADRARTPLVLDLLGQMQALPAAALAGLMTRFPRQIRNCRGLEVGRIEVVLPAAGK